MKKGAMAGLRLTHEELEKLDVHAQGQLSRAQVIHIIWYFFWRSRKKNSASSGWTIYLVNSPNSFVLRNRILSLFC
ncbi:MAG: hypothetical protein GKR89_36640 [Candidatus Latescibacteria bacterium]|nr:hypothetical protein [Candidatus Latescibacterota bacterium]